MDYIIWNWIRSCFGQTISTSTFPIDIIDLIIDTFLYHPSFDVAQKNKLDLPERYERVYKDNMRKSSFWESESIPYNVNGMKYDYDYLFKLVLIGDKHVGKSSYCLRLAHGKFEDGIYHHNTDFRFKTININGKTIKLQIWDCVSYYRNVASYLRRANGVIIMYDLTNKKSFENINKYNLEINKYAPTNTVKMLIGNKQDLIVDDIVSDEKVKKITQEYGISDFINISTKTGYNVEQAAERCVHHIIMNTEDRVIRPFYG